MWLCHNLLMLKWGFNRTFFFLMVRLIISDSILRPYKSVNTKKEWGHHSQNFTSFTSPLHQ
jgi:hypothetical protein